MIEINLLPHRYRQVESTPAKIGVAFIVGIVLVSIFAIALWIYYTYYIQEVEELNAAKESKSKLEATVTKLQSVEVEYRRQQKRKESVVKLFKSRMLLAPRLARLQKLVPETIMISDISFKTSQKRDAKDASLKIVRTLVMTGIVRAPELESKGDDIIPGQDGKDDERMLELSKFVRALQDDVDGFYKDCVGKIQYAPIIQSFKKYNFFYVGNPEPFKTVSIPVFTFGLTATAEYEDKPKVNKPNPQAAPK